MNADRLGAPNPGAPGLFFRTTGVPEYAAAAQSAGLGFILWLCHGKSEKERPLT